MMANNRPTESVRIRIEPKAPCYGHRRSPHYVARDKDGSWRAFGVADVPLTGRELAEYLFHADEIADVDVLENEDHVVKIYLPTRSTENR